MDGEPDTGSIEMIDNDNELEEPSALMDGVDEEEEEDFVENPVELIKEFGTHPLMEKAQKALIDQLTSTNDKLEEAVLDKEAELKRATSEREVLGVQLYTLQQQLARLQMSLENAHSEYNSLVDTKLQEQDMVRKFEENNKERGKLLSEHEKQHKKYKSELEALNETIRQIDLYNEEVKGEIALTRRATYKTEQNMQEMEKEKDDQDALVDQLGKKCKQLTEAIALHTDQLVSQKDENEELRVIIEDTVKELDNISGEKKQLMLQWKAAIGGLQRRDEALAAAETALAIAEGSVSDYNVEIDAAKRKQLAEQGRHEGLVNMRDRMENELSWVEENLNRMRQEREQLQERYTLLSKSLVQTDAETKKLDLITKQLTGDAEALLQNLQVVTLERQKLEEEVQLIKSTAHNVDKAVQNLIQQRTKVLKRIHAEENKATEIENEIARTRLDGMNARAVNDQLEEVYVSVGKEMTEKEQLIEKYQIEIRQRTDEIEKKMYRVDRLNKKYEKMVESAGGGDDVELAGPLEAAIKTLNKEIDNVTADCRRLERDWLGKQTELVAVAAENEKISDVNAELQARCTILTQQQLRLTSDLRELKSESKAGEAMNTDLRNDVSKLNVLIGENHEREGDLQNENYVLEIGCVEELKEMERQSVQLQATVKETRMSKAALLDEIVEAERQAMLWEKKIQLDKETKEALDPSVGQDEVANMEKEIHRMELRYDALKREMERLSGEMERAVLKRGAIQNRYSKSGGASERSAGKKKQSDSMTDLTQASAKKKMSALKKEARALAEQGLQYTAAAEERRAQLSEIYSEIERSSNDFAECEALNTELQTRINDLLYKKQLNQERIGYKQKYLKKMKELASEGVDASQSLQIERRLMGANQGMENVQEIISDLEKAHPHLSDVLGRVRSMTDADLRLVPAAQ